MVRRKLKNRDTQSGHDAWAYHNPMTGTVSFGAGNTDAEVHRSHSRTRNYKHDRPSLFGW